MGQLGAQSLAVGTFQQHLLKRKQKRQSRKRGLIAGLTLTSMVDMFSLLVIFLLQTFSTSPELVMVTKGVTLPVASTAREL
jgi:biopolymer transport protein ExbD